MYPYDGEKKNETNHLDYPGVLEGNAAKNGLPILPWN